MGGADLAELLPLWVLCGSLILSGIGELGHSEPLHV